MRVPLFLSVAVRFLRHEPARLDGLRLARATLRLRARRRPGRPIEVAITAPNGTRAELRLRDYIDVLVARELFLDREYRVPGRQVRSILDLGANTGISVRYFRAMYPGAQIVAVEPDPALHTHLEASLDGLDVPIIRAAVGATTGAATFYSAAEGWRSSLAPQPDARPVTVDVLSLDDLLLRAGRQRFDLVKMDIEGAEWEILPGLAGITGCVVGELHHREPGQTLERAKAAFPGWTFEVHGSNGVTTFAAYAAE